MLGACGAPSQPAPASPASTGTQAGAPSFDSLQDEMTALERRACATADITAVLSVKDELDALAQRVDDSSLTKSQEAALADSYDRSMRCMAPHIIEATRPKPGDPAYESAARVVEMQLGILEKVAAVFAAHSGKCDALVTELTKVLEAAKPAIDELNTLISKDPDAMALAETLLGEERFAGRAASANTAIDAGLQSCPDAFERSSSALSPR